MFKKFKHKKRVVRNTTQSDISNHQGHIFRRNRNLSRANKVGDYGGVNNSKASSRSHVHSLAIKRRKLSGIFLICLLSITIIFLMIINFTATPSMVLTDTSIIKSVQKSKYEDIIQDYLKENPFSRFLFILDDSKLTNYVSSTAPEVLNIEYKDMKSFGNNNFIVKLRKPVAGWTINNKQYYVDENGVQFEINYFENPKVQIIDKSGASETMSSSGIAIASKRFLSFVGQVVSAAKGYNYTVIKAILPEDTTRQLEIVIKENGFLVKLSLDRPVSDQLGDMDRAMKYFAKKHIRPSYIDVRVSGRVFY